MWNCLTLKFLRKDGERIQRETLMRIVEFWYKGETQFPVTLSAVMLVSGGQEFSISRYKFSWQNKEAITKNFLCITPTVEHNYISPSSTVGIQLHVSGLYVGHLQVVI